MSKEIPSRERRVQGGFDEIELVDSELTTDEILDYLRGERLHFTRSAG